MNLQTAISLKYGQVVEFLLFSYKRLCTVTFRYAFCLISLGLPNDGNLNSKCLEMETDETRELGESGDVINNTLYK